MPTKTLPFRGGRDLIPHPGRPTLAGGAVVTREDPLRGTEIVLIHRNRYDDWTLPKGKLEVGESIPVCAVREVLEETGVTIRLGVPLDTIRYQAGKVGLKKVSYWTGVPLSSSPREPDDEVDEVCWLPVRTAMSRLTYAHDHYLVTQFLEQPATTPLIIVRHAKAMDRKDWSRKDWLRPINSRGRKQARLLVPMLGAYGAQRLVSSNATRCVSTIEPYARRRDARIETYSQLSEEVGESDPKGVGRLIQKLRNAAVQSGQPTVICVHRPVLPHVLDALDMAPTTLVTGEFLVAHLTMDGDVHAVERHRPLA